MEVTTRSPIGAGAWVVRWIPVWGAQEAAKQCFSLITEVSISPSPFLCEINKYLH